MSFWNLSCGTWNSSTSNNSQEILKSNDSLEAWNSNNTQPATGDARSKLISDQALFYIQLIILGVACACLSVFGITTNILNIAVFCKQRFQDGGTISYFALTLSDLCSLIALLFSSICVGLEETIPKTRVDLISLQFVVFAWTRTMFVDISVMVTVYVSVERALCVLMPVTFKHTFSRFRKKIILTGIYIFGIACYIPLYSTMGLSWQWDASLNDTKLSLVYFGDRYHAELFNDIFNSIILVTASQFVVMASTIAMSVGLLRAYRFRLRNLTASVSGNGENRNGGTPPMVGKDMTMIKIIILVSIVYVLCNLPLVGMIYSQLLVPELNVGGLYFNTIMTLYGIVCFFAAINGSVNFFIYYTQGSKFRAAFHNLFKKKIA